MTALRKKIVILQMLLQASFSYLMVESEDSRFPSFSSVTSTIRGQYEMLKHVRAMRQGLDLIC